MASVTLRIGPADQGRRMSLEEFQAVYLALQVLTDAQVLRRIEPAGSAARYELHVGDDHHHLVCTRCARVVDVDCATEGAPCLLPADAHGFSVVRTEITFWGVCPDCAKAQVPKEEGAV